MKDIFTHKWIPFWLAGFTFLFVKLAVAFPDMVDRIYSKGIYPYWAQISSSVTNFIPFSLWDFFWTILFLLLIIGSVKLIVQRKSFKISLIRFLRIIALIYTLFYWSWGFNYFRPGLSERQKWTLKVEIADSLFKEQLNLLIEQTNELAGVEKEKNRDMVKLFLDEGYEMIHKDFNLPYPNGKRKPKPMLFARWIAASGISGYFGPFFNEVHVNQHCLPVEYPFALAHEMAHQFGIPSESEANFFAWLVCSTSELSAVRYSGNLMLLRYFLYDARKVEGAEESIQKISPNVKADFAAIQKHWNALRISELDEFQTKANNLYLKTNRVKGGIQDYNRVVKIVLHWKAGSD